MATSLKLIAAMLALCSAGTQAEVLPDPTRPAAEFLAPSAATDAAKAMPADDGLRTIIIAADRRSAVINGQQIPLGGKLGDERLMAVCEDSVVLQGAEGRREVPLYPGVDMHSNPQRRCNTPPAKPAGVAATTSKKKLNKINTRTPRSVAGKKEKLCK